MAYRDRHNVQTTVSSHLYVHLRLVTDDLNKNRTTSLWLIGRTYYQTGQLPITVTGASKCGNGCRGGLGSGWDG